MLICRIIPHYLCINHRQLSKMYLSARKHVLRVLDKEDLPRADR